MLDVEAFGYLERVIVTPVVYPRLLEFHANNPRKPDTGNSRNGSQNEAQGSQRGGLIEPFGHKLEHVLAQGLPERPGSVFWSLRDHFWESLRQTFRVQNRFLRASFFHDFSDLDFDGFGMDLGSILRGFGDLFGITFRKTRICENVCFVCTGSTFSRALPSQNGWTIRSKSSLISKWLLCSLLTWFFAIWGCLLASVW